MKLNKKKRDYLADRICYVCRKRTVHVGTLRNVGRPQILQFRFCLALTRILNSQDVIFRNLFCFIQLRITNALNACTKELHGKQDAQNAIQFIKCTSEISVMDLRRSTRTLQLLKSISNTLIG